MVNHLRLGEALLEPEGPADPRAVHRRQQSGGDLPRGAQGARAASRARTCSPSCTIPFLTDTAKYADIVLPATTYLETEDFYRAYGAYYMQYAPAAVPPQGEAWSNFRLAQALAQRMGLDRRRLPHAGRGGDRASCSGARPAAPRRLDPAAAARAAADQHRADAAGQEFRTPSGKLEFYSEQLASEGLPPMPDWQPDPEEVARRREVAAAPADRARLFPGPHRLFRRRLPAQARGRRRSASCIPTMPAQRGLKDGAEVRLFNDRGAVGLMLQRQRRGAAGRRAGARPAPRRRDASAAPSTCSCSDRYTDIGEGATYQSTLLDVAAW